MLRSRSRKFWKVAVEVGYFTSDSTILAGLHTCTHNHMASRHMFHTVEKLKCAIQLKTKCIQRFSFSSLGRWFQSVPCTQEL